jgi:uncharacterized membrane protein
MRKLRYLLLTIVLFTPFLVNAVTIENYNIDMTVQSDGNLLVVERFELDGSSNGFERILVDSNSSSSSFDGSLESFESSDIYNASNIELLDIKYPSNLTTTDLGVDVTNVLYASNGDTNKYVYNESGNEYNIRMYNPSSYGQTFYIKYLIEDVAVKHEDVSEIYWNIFSNQLDNDIDNLIVNIYFEDQTDELKVWAHGPLNGTIHAIDNNKVELKVTNLASNTPIDFRIIFAKDYLNNPIKQSGFDALDKILIVEKDRADIANTQREKAQEEVDKYNMLALVFTIIGGAGVIGFLYIAYNVYNKHDKEYESTFKTDYYREFPKEYGPEIVGYLFSRKTDTKELSASLLNLIHKKVILFEELPKKNLKLKLNKDFEVKISKSELNLITWLFTEIGTNDEVTMKDINSSAKRNYDKFLKNYSAWKNEVKKEAKGYNFFEDKLGIKAKTSLYTVLGIALSFGIFTFAGMSENTNYTIVAFVYFIIYLAGLIYFSTFIKRTKEGNEDYLRWRGLKKFINDFGKFEDRELPQIVLWEKYLVYAYVFGNAQQLSKVMKIKFTEMQKNNANFGTNMGTNLLIMNNLNSFANIDRQLSRGVNSAVSVARTERSSASGGGGGFSSGGGFGGGGGGGGSF